MLYNSAALRSAFYLCLSMVVKRAKLNAYLIVKKGEVHDSENTLFQGPQCPLYSSSK